MREVLFTVSVIRSARTVGSDAGSFVAVGQQEARHTFVRR